MNDKKLSVAVMLGLMAGFSSGAMAQQGGSPPSMGSMSSMSGGMDMPAMRFSGTVLRYNYGVAGYITAMQVRTAEGTQTLRFAPGMARELYSTYPVGRAITGTAQPLATGTSGGMRYDLVSLGEATAAPSAMQPTPLDADLLKATPNTRDGARAVRFQGKLQGMVIDEQGAILSLVLNGVQGASQGSGIVLVRVPPQAQTLAASEGSTRTPRLVRGAVVEVTGFIEFSPEGSISIYSARVAASAMSVGGRPVTALSLPAARKPSVKIGPADASGLTEAEARAFGASAR